MHADLVAVLRCPVCGDGLELRDRTARCGAGHAFDLAKQGYLNLLPSASSGIDGDSAEMVDARAEFLGRGWYAPIREALVESLPRYGEPLGGGTGQRVGELGGGRSEQGGGLLWGGAVGDGDSRLDGVDEDSASWQGEALVVEVGAGTAYYLAGVLEAGGRGIAVDVSRYAARRAAKVDPGIGSVVADAWRELPVRDGVADVVLDVFAPRNAAEMARVLKPGGTLLVVTPNQGHLGELIDVLGMVSVDGEKERRLVESLQGFERVGQRVVESTMLLDHAAIGQLVGMTPSARHSDAAVRAERIAGLADPMGVTLSVTVSSWRVVAG
ncbi:putative RNA methyltransferase [Kribbella sp. NPDC051770]|uniref:putative RNA methyltransferase n=1 Tax=Kribbella sp. NPDC051770 TaxID=3155413 RepID=UPI00342A6837